MSLPCGTVARYGLSDSFLLLTPSERMLAMQTMTGGFFLPRDYNFYDSCVMAVLGVTIFELYDIARRHVWRSTSKGEAEVRQMVGQGLIVARISQQSLGAHVGLKRVMVNRYVRRMRELGWLKVVQVSSGGLPVYVLGESLTDSVGKRHEIFYADAWMGDLWSTLVDHAKNLLGVGKTPTGGQDDAHDCSALGDGRAFEETSWVKAIPEVERARIVAEHLQKKGCNFVQVAESEPEEPEEPLGDEVPCLAGYTGGVQPGMRGGVQPNTLGGEYGVEHKSIEGSEVEKREVEKHSLASLRGEGSHPEELSRAGGASPDKRIPRQIRSAAEMDALIAGVKEHTDALVAKARDKVKADAQARAERRLHDSAMREQRKTNLKGKTYSLEERRMLNSLWETYSSAMKERWPSIQVGKWTPKDHGLCMKLMDAYSGPLVQQALSYVVEQWDAINTRIFKSKATYPSLGLIYATHEVLFAESQRFAELSSIYREYKKCYRENPNDLPPEELRERYRKIKPELEALGISLS